MMIRGITIFRSAHQKRVDFQNAHGVYADSTQALEVPRLQSLHVTGSVFAVAFMRLVSVRLDLTPAFALTKHILNIKVVK